MALRKRNFYSLEELNEAIRELLIKLNLRKMRHLGKSRQELFEQIDKPSLKSLPERSYEFGEWKRATVNVDYHVSFDLSYYSVPYQLIGKELWIRASASSIEIYDNLIRICSHSRTSFKNKYITEPSHRPKAHQEHAKWDSQRIVSWAKSKNEIVGLFVDKLIKSYRHQEQAYRSALGCIRLADKYGDERLKRACEKASKIESYRYITIKNILQNGMDKIDEPKNEKLNIKEKFADPANVRGSEYYH